MKPVKRYLEYWSEQVKWWCSRSLEWWAAHLTAFYFGGSIIVMGAKFDELILLKLNEIGDFAAGVFGPLAFLWLVLGYIQQGRELKLSSEALRMQAEELKSSVAQQCEMVAAQKISLKNYERSLEPLLHLEVFDAGWEEGEFYVGLKVNNTGDYCEAVLIELKTFDNKIRRRNIEPLISGASRFVRFEGLQEWEDFDVTVEYKTRSGLSNAQTFSGGHYQDPEDGDDYSVQKHAFLN
jgi:hypothetical protein